MSDFPWDITFEVAFDTAPGIEPGPSDWTDLSSRVRHGLTIRHGTPQGGTCTLDLNNRDRQLDPTNDASPYNLIPSRHARVRVTYDDTTYDLWRGLVKSWDPVWPEAAQALVRVEITDVTRWLALLDADLDLPVQQTHERIGDLLDLAGLPSSLYDIGDGVVWLDPYAQESASLLRVLLDTTDAEDGLVYVAPDGALTTRSRHATFDQASQVTVGVDGIRVRSVDAGWGQSQIINLARMELADGTVYEIADQDSIDNLHGPHSFPVRDLPMPWHETVGYADWLVYRFADAHHRLSRLTLQAHHGDALGSILPRRVGDLVAFVHTPPGGGTATVEGTIGRVEHRVSGGAWTTVWDLEPYFGAGPWMEWYSDEAIEGEAWLSDEATSGAGWAP